jgi:hypothetical protein
MSDSWANDSLPVLWADACRAVSHDKNERKKWYCSSERAGSNQKDYEAALADAAEGNERAQRYIAKFTELRLK